MGGLADPRRPRLPSSAWLPDPGSASAAHSRVVWTKIKPHKSNINTCPCNSGAESSRRRRHAATPSPQSAFSRSRRLSKLKFNIPSQTPSTSPSPTPTAAQQNVRHPSPVPLGPYFCFSIALAFGQNYYYYFFTFMFVCAFSINIQLGKEKFRFLTYLRGALDRYEPIADGNVSWRSKIVNNRSTKIADRRSETGIGTLCLVASKIAFKFYSCIVQVNGLAISWSPVDWCRSPTSHLWSDDLPHDPCIKLSCLLPSTLYS